MNYMFFSESELACKCGKCDGLMDDSFMRRLVILRSELDFPLPLSSAYRCPAHNDKVSRSGLNGPHTTGRAVDILVSHERAHRLIEEACRLGFTGIGIKQKGAVRNRFIHLDDLEAPDFPRPTVWSY